jgi:hypothetical protein
MNARLYAGGLGLTMAFVATAARAQETFDYTVQPGDTCENVAERVFGSRERYDRLHEFNPGLGPTPHHLRPGQMLRLPVPGPDAKVTFVRNSVEAATPAPHPAHLNEDLSRGHRVSTLADSQAEVTFFDRSRIQLGEHTLVVILGNESGKVSLKAGVDDTTLLSGNLRAHLGELAGSGKPATLPLRTKAGKVVLGGGEAKVSVDEKSTTRLAVYKGSSSIASSGKKVDVNAGFGSKSEVGRVPTPPKPLPPPPVWDAAPPTVTLVAESPDLVELQGSYAPASGSPKLGAWHVQLARDEAFRDLVLDAYPEVAITNLSARKVPVGEYWVRVSAVDTDYFEGAFNAARKLDVVRAEVRAPSKGKLATFSTSTPLFCSIDGGAVAKVEAEAPLVAGVDHVLRCGLRADDTSATVTIAAKTLGALRGTITATPFDAGANERGEELSVAVVDVAGNPIVDAPLVLTAPPPARIDGPPARAADGRYVARVRWPAAASPPRVLASVGAVGIAEASLGAATSKSVSGAVPGEREDVRAREEQPLGRHFEIEGALVAHFAGAPLDAAPGVAIAGTWVTPLGPGALALGLSIDGSAHVFGARRTVGCPGGAACSGDEQGYDVRTRALLANLSVLARYRWPLGARLSVALGVQPTVGWADLVDETFAGFSGPHFTPAGSALHRSGPSYGVAVLPAIELALPGHASVSLDVGYRWLALPDAPSTKLDGSGVWLGLRFGAAF